VGGHTKEVLATVCLDLVVFCWLFIRFTQAWHPTRPWIVSSGVDRRIKVWHIPDSVLKQGIVPEETQPEKLSIKPSRGRTYPSFAEITKSARAHQIHNPIANTWLIHDDHVDQVEWLDEIRLMTKARVGRSGSDLGRRGGVCAEIVIWRFDIIKELITETYQDNGLGVGIIAFPGHEGALRLIKRFVVPKQGFWGKTMGFDLKEGRICLPVLGGLWECQLRNVPPYWGLKNKPSPEHLKRLQKDKTVNESDMGLDTKFEDWEELIPCHPDLAKIVFYASDISPDGKCIVTSGEDGVLGGWRKLDASEVRTAVL